MKRLGIVVLLFLSIRVSAQVCNTVRNNEGVITRYARIQFGDTIIMGTSFHAKDKPGMQFEFSTIHNSTHFSFNLRSIDTARFDTIPPRYFVLQFTMNNNDTVNIQSVKKNARSHYPGYKSPGAVMLFFTSNLNLEQMITLAKNRISYVRLYIDDKGYIDLPVNKHENDEFYIAMNYLLL